MLLDLDFDVGTANLAPADVPSDAYHRIAQFLYREARLLDERRYDDWQALWTEDGMYWMPRKPGQESPYDYISLFWEDRMLRDVRIRRLEHPRNWSQQPPTRSVRPAWPPNWPSAKVDRLPRYTGTSSPLRTAR